uniref:Rho termination factor N-terminal domain-containing protein n=1 Tax=viral metagenome TaxID=1070528 RepID=A0A6C0HXB8_9ZZZZ
MALTDIFTTPFLISLGITLVLIGLLGMYLTQKLQEQNHKITSMFGLVTSMAEEMNFIRNRFQSGGVGSGPTTNVSNASSSAYASTSTSTSTSDNKLIDVSDGEEDDTDSSSESDDGYDDSSSEGDSDVDVDVDDLEEVDLSNKIKVVNISENFTINSSMNDIDVDEKREELDCEELDCEELDCEGDGDGDTQENDLGDDDDADDLSSKSSSSSDEELVNNGSIVVEELNSSDFIKSITMSLEATNIEISDYKKMSLNKLRALVVEKKLTSNANKLKKEELLKLLNAE